MKISLKNIVTILVFLTMSHVLVSCGMLGGDSDSKSSQTRSESTSQTPNQYQQAEALKKAQKIAAEEMKQKQEAAKN